MFIMSTGQILLFHDSPVCLSFTYSKLCFSWWVFWFPINTSCCYSIHHNFLNSLHLATVAEIMIARPRWKANVVIIFLFDRLFNSFGFLYFSAFHVFFKNIISKDLFTKSFYFHSSSQKKELFFNFFRSHINDQLIQFLFCRQT